MKLAITAIITLLGSSPFVFANLQDWSVWKQGQVMENSIAGQVKTIAINDESDQLIVKIKKSNGSIEVAKVCHEGIQSASNQVHGSSKLEMLKSAMASGSPVEVSYASTFDRCIDDVKVSSAAGQFQEM